MYRVSISPAAHKNIMKKNLTYQKSMLYIGKNSIYTFSDTMNHEKSRGKFKIHKASEKDDPAGTFPGVESFQKPVKPD